MNYEDKDFDDQLRAMLSDAEEEVPSYLMDEVFSRVNNKRRTPVWWWVASIGAAAAAVALGVFIHTRETENRQTSPEDYVAVVTNPSDNDPAAGIAAENNTVEDNAVSEEDGTIVIEEPISAVADDESQGNAASDIQTNRHKGASVSGNAAATEEETSTVDIHSLMAQAVDKQQEQNGTNAEEQNSDNAAETIDDAHDTINNTTDAEKKKAGRVADTYVDPFDLLEDEEDEHRPIRVSIAVGGDLSSNSDAKSVSPFSGMRTPPEGIENATYIDQLSKDSKYALPLSFGITTKLSLGKHWSVGAGINYSLLQRSFEGSFIQYKDGKQAVALQSDIRHTIHYIGIPANAYYNIVDGSKIKFYVYGGGTVEKAVANVYKVPAKELTHKEKVDGVQLSAGAGIGVELLIAKNVGLYLNPGVRYYFDCDQPSSIRTQQPLMMNFELGFRVGI